MRKLSANCVSFLRNIVHSAMSLFDLVCSRGLITSDQTQSVLDTCFWMSFKLNSSNGHMFSSAQFGRVVGCECLWEAGRSPLIGCEIISHHQFAICAQPRLLPATSRGWR